MKAAMALFAVLSIWIGVQPQWLYALLPYPTDFEPYTQAHVYEMLQLLLYSGLAFFVLLKLMKRTMTITLDFDWIYRKLAVDMAAQATKTVSKFISAFGAIKDKMVSTVITLATEHHNPRGVLARTTPAGEMAFWMVVVLCAYLIIYLFV